MTYVLVEINGEGRKCVGIAGSLDAAKGVMDRRSPGNFEIHRHGSNTFGPSEIVFTSKAEQPSK